MQQAAPVEAMDLSKASSASPSERWSGRDRGVSASSLSLAEAGSSAPAAEVTEGPSSKATEPVDETCVSEEGKEPPRADKERDVDEIKKQMRDARWNAKLQDGLSQVQGAQDANNPTQLEQARAGLLADYANAQQMGVQIPPELDQAIKQLLAAPPAGQQPAGGGGLPPSASGMSPFGGGGGGVPAGGAPLGGGGGYCPNGGCDSSPAYDEQPPAPPDAQPSADPIPDGMQPIPETPRNMDAQDNFDGGLGTIDRSPWNAQDAELLSHSLGDEQKAFGHDLITTWAQGAEGNCVTVAEIKAGMATYGNKVFDSVAPDEKGGYNITMQDGYKLSLSQRELSIAKQESNFKGRPSEELAFAHLAYAATAKRAMQMGHEGARSMQGACNALNNGENDLRVARFMGLREQVVPNRTPYAKDGPAAFGSNRNHEMFISGGKVDRYGHKGSGTYGMSDYYSFKPFPSHKYNVRPTPPAPSGTPQGSVIKPMMRPPQAVTPPVSQVHRSGMSRAAGW